uniref:Pyruvoyl-dependent arginine decarboxylase AaxB n=1 Tax=Candidatus Kentrum sp. LPFa TaxID=2126335 RepID=A0A450Y1V9_9GAMM|nr:MAG: Pyruvoyl-dependent arginine decarboxylase (PvlArgDC) [Candidatus Kentron sp. LPFa]VFK35528.1 MAG: Pyruvoyl-dependent arginine decarboxylase (PvlArgDC) [Candidatus Kentron sp. LPFa]
MDSKQYGYISEHHRFYETKEEASKYAEDLAASMLASAYGIELDTNTRKIKDQHEHLYFVDGKTYFKSRNITQTAKGHKDGLWTTVVAAAIMLF